MILPFFLLILGMAILIAGAEGLVRGASSIASRWGISPIVIGLTIVSFGTSAPELLVNLLSAINGSTDLAIGNIVGSNIANIWLILGVTAIMYPLAVKENTTFKEVPFALFATILVLLLGNDAFLDGGAANQLSRLDGLIFLTFFCVFLYYTYGISKVTGEKDDIQLYSWSQSLLMLIAGMVALAFGGDIIVDNAMLIATNLGIPERIIGLTIVAIGTSLPELATSVIAALRKHTDIAIGNAVGSNIFNILWILGLTSTIRPIPFNAGINIDVMVAIAAVLLLLLFIMAPVKRLFGTRHVLNRWQGFVFLFAYIAYLIFVAIAPFCIPSYCPV